MSLLQNKRILITGAARGLGFAFAQAVQAAGAKVAIADILVDRGQSSAKALDAVFIPLDLADPASIQQCAQQAAEQLDGLDGLVNNGAIATGIGGKNFDEFAIDTWDQVMNVNARGTWLMIRAVVPYLRASGAGAIVNIASDTALWGAPKLLHYVASKGAVIAMTRSLARELGNDNIAVNAIAPGLTLGEATAYVPAERHQYYIDGRAINRAQQPEDISAAVVFFLSAGAAFITGQVLPVNGGFVLN